MLAQAQSPQADSLRKADSIRIVFMKDSLRCTVRPNWRYAKSYWTDTKAVIAAPFHWKGRDFVKLGIVTAVSLSLYSIDQRVKDWSQENRSKFTDKISAIVDPLGNGRYLMLTSGAIFLHGQLFGNRKTTRVGLLILESQLINGVLGQFVKVMTGRERPRTGGRYNDWNGLKIPPDLSFPSGHAQTSFALMTVIALEFKEIKWIPPVAYTLAGLTSLSRINENAHWASDVFVGAVLGYFISKKIVDQHTKPNNRLSLTPFTPQGTNGLTLKYKF
jgi:PAP2 superfamily